MLESHRIIFYSLEEAMGEPIKFTVAVDALGMCTYIPPEDIQEFFRKAPPEVLKTAEKYFARPMASAMFLVITAFTSAVIQKGEGKLFIDICASLERAIKKEGEEMHKKLFS